MEDFKLEPARDLGLSLRERTLSLRRESGLVQTVTHVAWWAFVRSYMVVYHRLSIQGLQNLPDKPPFVLIANHASHLDALVLASPLSWRLRDRVFPIAAGDVFFEVPAIATFAMTCLNALPMWRHNAGRHALKELRSRLVDDCCGYVLFPEGRRSPDGSLLEFKAGLGMLVAETDVPVVPCWIEGAHRALPRDRKWPRPRKLSLRVGEAMRFGDVPNRREGWDQITSRCRAAVESLAPGRGTDPQTSPG